MSSGKANIHSTNTPPNIEPNTSTITKTHEPKEQAKEKPRKEHNKCSFQEHSLWLCKPLYGIKARESLWETEGIKVNTSICGNGGICLKQSTPLCCKVEDVSWCTGTKGVIVGNGICRTPHWEISEIESYPVKKEPKRF